jgi:hypothetical protein
MTIENIKVDATTKRVNDLVAAEKGLSPALEDQMGTPVSAGTINNFNKATPEAQGQPGMEESWRYRKLLQKAEQECPAPVKTAPKRGKTAR